MRLRRLNLVVLLGMITVIGFALQWGNNDIIKITSNPLDPFTDLMDYENITNFHSFFKATDPTNAWLRTYDIPIGEDYIAYNIFIHLTNPSTNNYIDLKLKDSYNDEVILQQVFSNTGVLKLTNVYNRDVYLFIDFSGTDIMILSMGMKRMIRQIILKNEFSISPQNLFYGVNQLKIQFRLRMPAELDLIVFDQKGVIIGYILRDQFLTEGDYTYIWEPQRNKNAEKLKSGPYFVYVKAIALDGAIIEHSKGFLFIKD